MTTLSLSPPFALLFCHGSGVLGALLFPIAFASILAAPLFVVLVILTVVVAITSIVIAVVVALASSTFRTSCLAVHASFTHSRFVSSGRARRLLFPGARRPGASRICCGATSARFACGGELGGRGLLTALALLWQLGNGLRLVSKAPGRRKL